MTTFSTPPAPRGPVPGPSPSWPTEPGKSDDPARLRSQAAVYVVAALAIGIVCVAGDAAGWGVAGALALGAGVAIGLAFDLRRPFGGLPGAAAAAVAMLIAVVLLMLVGGPAMAYAAVPLLGAFVLGLDWHLVRRLRPLPFAFGFLVVIGVAGGETWTYPAAVVWLVCALGALTSLESDRRAAQAVVAPVTAGPMAPDVQTTDVVTTVLIALAIAITAALLLSTPSCRHPSGGGGGGSSIGSGSEFGPGSEFGSGSENGSGSGSGSGSTYTPDADGRFLVPDEGGDSGVPSPELLPRPGDPARTLRLDDGRIIVAERNPDGSGRIVVTDPDGTTRTFEYQPGRDGTTQGRELDEEGRPGETLTYDPDGRIGTTDPSSGSQPDPEPTPDDEKERPDVDGRIVLGVLLLLAAGGALAWWLSRRSPKAPPPTAPPWAIRLAREIDREGAARGPRRTRSQSLTRYAEALRAGPLPDDRVPDVADVVATALFGPTPLGPDAQAWAESTWAAVVADHPAPGRAARCRARATSSA